MARIEGATVRRGVLDVVKFPTVRVTPRNLQKFKEAREARGCSFAALTDEVLDRLIFDRDGRPVALKPAVTPINEELPLQTAS